MIKQYALCLAALFLLTASKGWAGEMKSGFVPEWAKKAVWYQIFPERFRNGDVSNDPTIDQVKGAWPHDGTSPWEIHPWGSDWYKLQDYEKKNGKDIWYNLQRRRYGGDLQGIIDKLDYISELGITAIYLNPIFESPSLHKYDAIRYEHVDPNFGPDPEGDRKLMESESPHDPSSWHWTSADRLALELIRKAHERGIKVIFDGVFNHIGIRNPMFEDLKKNQQASPYQDWFTVKEWENKEKGIEFDYECWFGFRELPEWREDDGGIVSGPKKYIFDITKRWMDPNGDGDVKDGIDGWRLDVAYCVKHPFWKDWSKHVKSINPEAYMTAEIIDTPEVNKPYLQGDEFTAVMNYNFAFAVTEFCIGRDGRQIKPSEFDKALKDLRESYDNDFTYGMQNLLDSHDTARVGSHIVNKKVLDYRSWDKYCQISQAGKGLWDVRKPDSYERSIQKLMALIQMTYVGAPMVYYGDEVGMWGANDPCCRKPMLWKDIRYEDEICKPDGTHRAYPDKVAPDMDMYEYYKKLISIRNSSEALQLGTFETVKADDERNIFIFTRRYNGEKVTVVINNSPAAIIAEVPSEGKEKHAVEAISGRKLDAENGIFTVMTMPRQGYILKDFSK